MSIDHELWLQKQGVKIVNRRTLRRVHQPGYINWAGEREDGRIDWSEEYTTTNEEVYQVELNERTIDRLQRLESMVQVAMEHASRANPTGMGRTGGVGSFYMDNLERHHELLQENAMYRDSWREFQSIRVLLGETPHWP